MGLPKDYSPLLKAVAHMLLSEQLNGRLVDVNLLVAPLNSLGSGGINDNAVVDADMIKTAFTQRPAVAEYGLPYSHINIGQGGERVLIARIGVRRDSTNKNAPRVTEFGCFNSVEEGLSEDLVATKSITTDGSTINIGSAEYPFAIPFNAASSLLPTAIQDSLVIFLKDKPFNRSANSTQPKKKQKTKEQSEQQQLAAANDAFLRDTDKLETAQELVERYREIVKRRDDYINDINKKRDVYTNRCLACVDKAKASAKQHTDFIKNKLATLREESGGIDIPSALDQTQAMDDNKDTSNNNSSSQLLFIHRGRCGKMPIPASGVIVLDELEDGLLPLQSNGNNGNNNDTNNESTLDQRRAKVNYERDNHGSGECWVPRGSVAKAIAVLNRLEESHNMVCKLANVFEGKQCGFDPFVRQYFTAASITGYGCSDEAAILLKTTTLKCVLLVMTSPGDAKPTKLRLHDVTNKQISKAVQSRATLKSDEHQLAADCMLVSRQELIDDKAKFRDNKSMLLGGQFDHGERNNLQQYPKLGDWAGVCSETGKKTIKTRCIDVDACSHGAIACAESIKYSFKEFLKGIDAELYFAMGDTGGGGAIQHIHPLLIENGAMPEDSKRGNCILHGFAKAYQRGNEDVGCTYGLFHNSPYQLLWMFPDIMKRSVRRFGRKNHDDMWAKVAHKIIFEDESQREALKNHPQAYERLMRQVEEDECEPTKAPVDIQDAVFSRWFSVGETNEDFLEVYPIFYAFLIAIVNHVGPKCDLGMRCLTALSLMKTRAIPKVGEGIPIATTETEASQLFVDDGSIDAIKLKPGDSPTFYTILLFAHGFYTYFYKDANNFFLKCDPVLGKGTHGFLARLLHERLYATHKKLSEIENGGWRNKEEFKRYLTALEGVSGEATLEETGKVYFERTTTLFFKRFRLFLDKHVLDPWRSSNKLHYMIGGNPEISLAFSKWIVHFDDIQGEVLVDEGTIDEEAVAERDVFSFEDENVVLGIHHDMSHGAVKINTKDCMEWLTAEADRNVILEDRFVRENMPLIREHAESVEHAESTIDIFDPDTWNEEGNEHPLALAVWQGICPQPIHQQSCENFVQACSLVSKTHVGQERRTSRAVILSSIIREINKLTSEKRDDVARVQGSGKNEMILDYLDSYFKKVAVARTKVPIERRKEILAHFATNKAKQSSRERERDMKNFDVNLNKPRFEYAAEKAATADLTALAGGDILLKILTKKNGFEEHVIAEIKARLIKMTKKQKKSYTIAEKRALLRKDERLRRMKVNTNIQLKVSDIKAIKPISEEMKSILPQQEKIINKEHGIEE